MPSKIKDGPAQPTRAKRLLVGVDIGGTKTAVVVSAELPHVLWRAEFQTQPAKGYAHALDQIVQLIRSAVAAVGGEVQAIGVSCGGPLERATGIIQSPPNLPTWYDVPIKTFLQDKFDVPCFVENDANAGAVAEHRFGAGRGCRHMAFLTLGTGLGAGLILNGHIYHGAGAMAGEIGHIRLTEGGPEGHDKRGSVEGWASGGGMARHGLETILDAIAAGEHTSLSESVSTLTARDIGFALAHGDPVAERIVTQTGVRLGEACAILVDLLNPERIVIGGMALRLGDHLLVPARDRMHAESLSAAATACTILPAALGEGVGDVAALCIAAGFHHGL